MQAILGKTKDNADNVKKIADAQKNLKAANVRLHPRVRAQLIAAGFKEEAAELQA